VEFVDDLGQEEPSDEVEVQSVEDGFEVAIDLEFDSAQA
jgi:hypothetical protein